MLRSSTLTPGLFCIVALFGVAAPVTSALAGRVLVGTPEVGGGAANTAQDDANIFADLIDEALASTAPGQASLGEPGADHLALGGGQTGFSAGNNGSGGRAWGQIFGEAAHEGERGGVNGYEAGTLGFALGADTQKLIEHAVLGVGLSYGHTNVQADDINTTRTDIDTYQASLYGDYDLGNRAFLRGMAAFGFNDNDNDRHNAGGTSLTAAGQYDAEEYTLLLKTGRRFDLGGAVVTPSALARWVNYDPQNYTETGAGANDLSVQQKNVNVVELGLGGDVAWKHRDDDGSWLSPSLHAGYRYAVVDDRVETTSSFTGFGSPFLTQGPAPARSRFNAGAGLSLYTTSSWEFKASYDLDYREDYLANSGILRGSYKF